MSIENLALAAQSASSSSAGGGPFVVGEQVFIRTLAFFWVGRVSGVSTVGLTTFVHLENASWVADQGRFHNSLKTGKFAEVELCVGEAKVNVAAICDWMPFTHKLPDKTTE